MEVSPPYIRLFVKCDKGGKGDAPPWMLLCSDGGEGRGVMRTDRHASDRGEMWNKAAGH